MSPRTINIFAINFLILSVWSANSVFYDILRLSIYRNSIHCLPAAPIFGEHFTVYYTVCRVCVSVLSVNERKCHAVVQISVMFWLYLFIFRSVFYVFSCTHFFSLFQSRLYHSFFLFFLSCVCVCLWNFRSFFLGGGGTKTNNKIRPNGQLVQINWLHTLGSTAINSKRYNTLITWNCGTHIFIRNILQA